ncbi:MAG: hypothetical protein Q9180_000764 [Flavoplaca navasiana]
MMTSRVKELSTGKIITFIPPLARPMLPQLPKNSTELWPGVDFVKCSHKGFRERFDPKSEPATTAKDVSLHAMVMYLRYNELGEQQLLALVNVAPDQMDKEPYKSIKGELKNYSSNWQKSMVGCQSFGTDAEFLRNFIGHEVTTHNVKAHICNLDIEAARLQPPAGETPSETVQHNQAELLAAAQELHYQWLTAIKGHRRNQEDRYKSMSHAERESPTGFFFLRFLDQLAKDIVEAQDFRNPSTPISNANVRQTTHLYYHEMDPETQTDFWSRRLTIEVANHFWRHMYGMVPIQANLDAPHIGDIMRQTFVITAMATWDLVMQPVVEKSMMQQLGSVALKNNMDTATAKLKPQFQALYKMYRDIPSTWFKIFEGDDVEEDGCLKTLEHQAFTHGDRPNEVPTSSASQTSSD